MLISDRSNAAGARHWNPGSGSGKVTAVGVASMTGFARTEGEAGGLSWVWEVKSVNAKSLDLRLRLAAGFDSLEPQLRAELLRRFRRGSFSGT
jgi:uncharacterized protein YicC (UPF0701 family)